MEPKFWQERWARNQIGFHLPEVNPYLQRHWPQLALAEAYRLLPVSALPEAAQRIVMMNPLYYYVTFVRTCIIDGVSPEPTMYAQCLLYAIAAVVVGAWVFKKNQDKFVLYL